MYIPRIGRRPSKGQRPPSPLSKPNGLAATLTALALIGILAGCVSAPSDNARTTEQQAPLDRIWPYELQDQPFVPPLKKQDQEFAEAAFVQWLEAYLRNEYQVIDRRFFWGKGESAIWVAIGKGHALYPENENGRWRVLEEIEQDWRSPGYDLVRIWKVNIDDQDRYFAIAMTNEPVPGTHGRHLIGRFELEKTP